MFRERIELHGENAGERLHFHTREDEEGFYLEIGAETGDGLLFLIVPEGTDDIGLEMVMNAGDFEGRVGLAHHFHEPARYEFLDYEGDAVRIGRREEGEAEVLDDGHHHAHGWASLRVAADGRHFHAYADDEMIAHGHTSPWDAGYTGILMDGSGEVGLRTLHLIKLREIEELVHDDEQGHDHDDEHDHDHDRGQ